MIRVTFYNNKHFDYIYLRYAPNQIVLTNRFGQTEYYDYDSILKIEKQIKDLTLEEITKLKLRVSEIFDSSTGNREFYVYDRYNDYNLNDYIDITDIVKGSVKEE